MSAKSLRLLKKEKISPVSDLFTFEKTDSTPFEFTGGQYVILNTGFNPKEEKPIKRAYSILSPDHRMDQFQICVKRLAEGKASQILNVIPEGSELEYSGPWGKFAGNPDWPALGSTLILSTDTGITTLLGLLRSKKFSSKRKDTKAVWLRVEGDEFLSESKVRSLLGDFSGSFEIRSIPAISDSERVPKSLEILGEQILSVGAPTNAFLSGDGNVLRACQAELVRLGIPESQIGIEAFFHTGRTISPGAAKV